jgi:hypothetical protein
VLARERADRHLGIRLAILGKQYFDRIEINHRIPRASARPAQKRQARGTPNLPVLYLLRAHKKARAGRAFFALCGAYLAVTTATLTSLAEASLLLSTGCFAVFFVAGALSALEVGILEASGTGAAASCEGEVAEAEIAASYSHAEPKAGARPSRATAAAADIFIMSASSLSDTDEIEFARVESDCQPNPPCIIGR